jgi:hypothetical protein
VQYGCITEYDNGWGGMEVLPKMDCKERQTIPIRFVKKYDLQFSSTPLFAFLRETRTDHSYTIAL